MNESPFDITEFNAAITHPDRDVRLRSAMDAGSLLDQDVTASLVSRVGVETDFHVRECITWALVQHGEAATPAVLSMLNSDDPAERRQAAHILSKIGDPSYAPHLLGVVADEDPDVAIKAYRAAASTGRQEMVAPLVARLGHGETEQRDALSNALAQMGGAAVDALVSALRADDSGVRLHAAEALAQMGADAEASGPALGRLVSDEDNDVALAAVMALGSVGGAAAAAALLEVSTAAAVPLNAVARRLLSDLA